MTSENVKELAILVKKAKEALKDAQNYADQHHLSFVWSDTYGLSMQTYQGAGVKDPSLDWEDSTNEWAESDSTHSEGGYLKEGRWVSSSDNC